MARMIDGITELSEKLERMYWEEIHGVKAAPGRPLPAYTLEEVSIMPSYSEIHPRDVSLESTIGGIKMPVPFFTAPMDTVTGEVMASTVFWYGGVAIVYRMLKARDQIGAVENALRTKPCLISDPVCLHPDDTVADAKAILNGRGFSTIPVIDEATRRLLGVLFTRDVAFDWHSSEPISKWMTSVDDLKTVSVDTPYEEVRDRLLKEQRCSVLPVVDGDLLAGIYFMKDFLRTNPAMIDGRPMVGMAINDKESDLERARACIDLGVCYVVIDSSHGNCKTMIRQIEKLREVIGARQVAIIAGNVADIDGYIRLSEAGADVVKLGIGPGSICSTSIGTGVGYPMWTLIQKVDFARSYLTRGEMPAADIIADGSVNAPGHMGIALGVGADGVMAGRMPVAWNTSISYQNGDTQIINGKLYVRYRGMASKGALNDQNAGRYGDEGKMAAEGTDGFVEYEGPIHKKFPELVELVSGGLAHTGSEDLSAFRRYCATAPGAWALLSSSGQNQNRPRVF